MIRWDDVRYFLAIHRSGTLSGAARALAVDHTTVGRRLTTLEESLGARLFDRTPDGFVLTTAGQCVLRSAEAMEGSVFDLERQVSAGDARTTGTVRISTSEAFAETFLLPWLGELRRRYTGIYLEFGISQAMVDLARLEADLALRIRPRGMPPAPPDLIALKLADIAFALYGSEEYLARCGIPSRPDNLCGHDLVGFDTSAHSIPGVAWLAEAGREATFVVRCSSILSLLGAARAGMGLAVLPCYAADAHRTLRRLSEPVDWSVLWLVVHPDIRRAARIRLVMDSIIDLVHKNARMLRGEAGAAGEPSGEGAGAPG